MVPTEQEAAVRQLWNSVVCHVYIFQFWKRIIMVQETLTLPNSCGFGSWPRDATEPYRKATTTAGPNRPVTKRYSDSLPRKLHKKITGYGAPKTVWLVCGTNWINKTRSRHYTGSPTSRNTENTAKYQTRTKIWRTMTKEASAQMRKRNTEELHEMQWTYTSVSYKWKAITVCRYNRNVPSFTHFHNQEWTRMKTTLKDGFLTGGF